MPCFFYLVQLCNVVEKWGKAKLDELLAGGENGNVFGEIVKGLINQGFDEDELQERRQVSGDRQ